MNSHGSHLLTHNALLAWLGFVVPLVSLANAEEVKLKISLDEIYAPVRIYTPPTNGGVLLTEADGHTIRFFYRFGEENVKTERYIGFVEEGASAVVYEDASTDGGLTWQRGLKAFETPRTSHSDVAAVHPDTGEIYWLYRRLGKTYLIRTSGGRKDWSNQVEVPFATKFDSTSLIWLRDMGDIGDRRLVVATRSLTGNPGSETWVSDDDGVTWQGPSNICDCPRHPDRWGDFGISAHVVELRDGRLWMLLRNSQDHLWEYFSDDRGLSWGKGRPSRFTGVFSNVRLVQLPDGRLIICWLNAIPMSGQRKQWNAHKTARDALHVAISDDDGETWRGFREVLLNTQRHERIYAPAKATDASVHHQKITFTRDGKAIVFTGQDAPGVGSDSPHRQAVIFDLDWLYETSRRIDFSDGYENLSTQKFSKEPWPGTYDYSRTHGATIIEHPTKPFSRVLHPGREKCDWVLNEQDGANWNFPAGKQGQLKTRILFRKGFQGGSISLVDCFYPPSDNAGDKAAMYQLAIDADGKIAGTETVLAPDTWHDVLLEWSGTENGSTDTCTIAINGKVLDQKIRLDKASRNGISYVRFRSTAHEEDLAGWLVESIDVDVSDLAKADRQSGEYEATILSQKPLEYWRCNARVRMSPNTSEPSRVTRRNTANLASSNLGATPGVGDSPALRPSNGFYGFESTNTWFGYADGGMSAFLLPTTLNFNARSVNMTAVRGSVSFWLRADMALTGNEVLYYGSPHHSGSGPDGFGDGGSHSELHTHFHADGRLGAGIYHGKSDVEVATVGKYNDNQWHHVAFTWSHRETALYIDGGKLSGGETVVGPASSHTFAFSERHVFGKTTMNAFEYSGDADELAIWNDSLTAKQVSAQYSAAISRLGDCNVLK